MSRAWYLHPAPVVFRVTGKDARRYLNNRFSQDLRSTLPGSAVRAGSLTPQGRVEGLFTVYTESDDTFYLAADGGKRQPLFAALSRYIVADRVSIVDCSSESLAGHIVGDVSKVASCAQGSLFLSVAQLRIDSIGFDFLIVAQNISEVRAKLTDELGSPLVGAEYDLRRFDQGYIQYPEEVNESLILTEAGLYDAVSFSKGCYVGQEVIERSDAIGKLPRQVERILLDGIGDIAPQAAILGTEGKPLGRAISAFKDNTHRKTKVFALLKTGLYSAGDAVQCEGLTGLILSRKERKV